MINYQYYSIDELIEEWSPWDLTKENLLKFGAENTLRFSIKKDTLLKLMPYSIGIDFHCPCSTENSNIPCVKANRLKTYTLSETTLSDLRNSNKAKVTLYIDCRSSCKHYNSIKSQILNHHVRYPQGYLNDLFGALYNSPEEEVDLNYLNEIFCQNEDLVVTDKEKQRFEKKYLNTNPEYRKNLKESTLLRAIGVLLIANYNKPPYKKIDSGEFIASSIANQIIKQISMNDYDEKGISVRTLEKIIPAAIDIIKSNKINK